MDPAHFPNSVLSFIEISWLLFLGFLDSILQTVKQHSNLIVDKFLLKAIGISPSRKLRMTLAECTSDDLTVKPGQDDPHNDH